jgi:hypothetical protein
MELRWEQFPGIPTIHVLMYGTDEVARFDRHSQGWSAEVGRHMRDHQRHKRGIFDTREEAMTRAEEWTRANLRRIKT